MKLLRPLLLASLLLALTACGTDTEPTPAVTDDSSSSSTPADTPSPSAAEPEHLEFYDQFDHYNNSVDEHDFMISEAQFNGQLCYCFRNDDYEYPILIYAVPQESDSTAPYQATLCLEGSGLAPLEFEMPTFILGYGNVSGVASFELADLTGDGSPELIYIYGGGGMGFWYAHVKIFDLTSLTELPVHWDDEALSASVQLTPVEFTPSTDSHYSTMVYAITDPDGQTFYGSAFVYEDTSLEPSSAYFGDNTHLDVQDGRLILASRFSSLGAFPGCYLGNLTVPFVYDPATASFALDDSFTMTIYEPVEPST